MVYICMWYVFDRNRPRSTRINKRFLSRTVASAALSRPSRSHAALQSTSRVGVDKTRHHRHHHRMQRQQKTDLSQHEQGGRASQGQADKRKHSADASDSCTDSRQTDVYDVYDYMTLNEEHKPKLEKKRQTTDRRSVSSSSGSAQLTH